LVQAAYDVQACLGGIADYPPPSIRNYATDRSDSDDQASNARFGRFINGQVGHAQVNRATGKTNLTRNPFGPPLHNSKSGLGVGRVVFFPDQYQVGR
jgi:hypothetical protein